MTSIIKKRKHWKQENKTRKNCLRQKKFSLKEMITRKESENKKKKLKIRIE